MKKILLLVAHSLLLTAFLHAQRKQTFTHADTLRGSITPERAWWDVFRYDITVKPNYESKTIEGICTINFKSTLSLKKSEELLLKLNLKKDSLKIQKYFFAEFKITLTLCV